MFGFSHREILDATNCEVPSDRHFFAHDAQWPTERPAERLGQADQDDYGQTQKNGRRSRGSGTSGMVWQSLSVQWGTVHSSRSGESDAVAGRSHPEEKL